MSRGQSERKSTRFSCDVKAVEEDWHALGTTEVLVLDSGRWTDEAVIAQVAMMCRVAPTWDRVLRWPSPLHLARAVVRDHPLRYFGDGDLEAAEVEDGKQLRFDFGMF